ncbi:MAG: alkylation response protein AidB-like acyl-CoA dehydrogenase [Parvicella sp.]|jgi:alkylation response protein AidB-like acyl-CoA dehydrogenase
MALVLNDEQQMLVEAASEFFNAKASTKAFRELRASDRAMDPVLWQELVDFGWPAIIVPEQLDGLDFGMSALGLLAIEAGKNLSVSPLFSSAALGVNALLQCTASPARDDLIQSIASGQTLVALAFNEANHFAPNNIALSATKTEKGFVLNGNKAFVAEASYADKLLVVARHESDLQLFVVASDTDGVTRQKLELMDRRDYANIEFSDIQIEPSLKLDWQADNSSDAVASMTNVGALMAAAEMYGCIVESFERTRVYLIDREQFGRKIGSFQAVRHRAALMYTQIELLKSVLLDALHAVETNRKDASLAVSHVKTLANQTGRLVTQEAIQLHGGIGITDELDIGLFYKRVRVLQSAYGDSNYHKDRFATLSAY